MGEFLDEIQNRTNKSNGVVVQETGHRFFGAGVRC
jgi:hypothetical protein